MKRVLIFGKEVIGPTGMLLQKQNNSVYFVRNESISVFSIISWIMCFMICLIGIAKYLRLVLNQILLIKI